MNFDTKKLNILAIETSCDETATAVVEVIGNSKKLLAIGNDTNSQSPNTNVKILSNVVASQIDIHKKFGGVFPEHASRAHCEKIIPVVEEALGKIDPDIIAVTTGPGLIGSLLVGVNFAKTYAYANNLPIVGINHLTGHIYSCFVEEDVIYGNSGVIKSDLLSDKKSQPITRSKSLNHNFPTFPALILIVSGGHTGLVLMKSHDEIIPIGQTLDDAAGEAFDKVAKLLQLGYPGGPAISKAAEKFQNRQKSHFNRDRVYSGFLKKDISLPRPMLDRKDFNFSFSGLKTAVLYKVKEIEKVIHSDSVISGDSSLDNKYNKSRGKATNHYKSLIATEFQQAVIDILVGKTIQAAYKYRPKSICLCGGVSANKELRKQLKKAVSGLPWNCSYHLPPMELTTDNAAMIGIAASYHLDKVTTWDKINANTNLKL